MKCENRTAKALTVILAVALIVGATGCATQATGGSKLNHNELVTDISKYKNLIKVCNQAGAVMHCTYQDRHQVREEHDRMVEAMGYRNYR